MRKFVPFAALALLAGCGFERVDSTERCFETYYGEVVSENMEPGLNYTGLNDATCFKLTDNDWPGGFEENGTAKTTVLSTNNSDKIVTSVRFGLTWAHDPTVLTDVFEQKRDPQLVLGEIDKAIADGFISALAGWSTDELLGDQRTSLGDSILLHINRKMGNLGAVKKVFVTGIGVPEEISKQQLLAMTADRRQETARRNFIADSLEQRTVLYQAEVEAEKAELNARVLQQSPALQAQEIERVRANAVANVLRSCTTNCIIGGTVADKFFGTN